MKKEEISSKKIKLIFNQLANPFKSLSRKDNSDRQWFNSSHGKNIFLYLTLKLTVIVLDDTPDPETVIVPL